MIYSKDNRPELLKYGDIVIINECECEVYLHSIIPKENIKVFKNIKENNECVIYQNTFDDLVVFTTYEKLTKFINKIFDGYNLPDNLFTLE